jgi:hypothetical protein
MMRFLSRTLIPSIVDLTKNIIVVNKYFEIPSLIINNVEEIRADPKKI